MSMTRTVDLRILTAIIISVCLSALPLAAQARLIPLSEMTARAGVAVQWDPLSESIILHRDGHFAHLRPDHPLLLLDYSRAELVDPPVHTDRGIFFSSKLADRLEGFFSEIPLQPMYRVGAILLDPGHGGRDPGAIGKTTINGKTVEVKEKDVVLKVALDLHQRLTRAYPDKRILLTRSGDTFPTLEQRVEMANSVKLAPHEAILYISIHANAAFNPRSRGFEVWYLSPDYRRTVIDTDSTSSDLAPILNSMMEEEFTTESILIAKSILDGLDRQIGQQSPNRGLKAEQWFVVRNARMPSVLIELGFVSNPDEARLLATDEYLRRSATGIYNGITSFINHFEGVRGHNTNP